MGTARTWHGPNVEDVGDVVLGMSLTPRQPPVMNLRMTGGGGLLVNLLLSEEKMGGPSRKLSGLRPMATATPGATVTYLR